MPRMAAPNMSRMLSRFRRLEKPPDSTSGVADPLAPDTAALRTVVRRAAALRDCSMLDRQLDVMEGGQLTPDAPDGRSK